MAGILRTLVAAAWLFPAAPARAEEADRALQTRLDAVRAAPNDPRNHFNLGYEYYQRSFNEAEGSEARKKLLTQAAASFERALEVNRKDKAAHDQVDLSAYQVLGNIMLELREFGDAADWFEKGLDRFPDDPTCLFGRGQAYYLAGKQSKAIAAFEEYLKRSEGKSSMRIHAAQARTYLGAMAMSRRRYDEAAAHFRKVIEEFPKQAAEARRNLSLVLMAQGDEFREDRAPLKAIQKYDEAVAADPSHAAALVASGHAHFTFAEEHIRSAKADERESALSHFKIALQRLAAAVKTEERKDDFRIWFELGVAQFHLERFDDMIESYRKSVALNPDHPDARYNLALALYRKQLYEEALEQAEKAKTLAKGDRAAANLAQQIFDEWQEDLLRKATEAFTADRVPEAIAYWEQVLRLNPRQPDAPKYIAQAKQRLIELRDEHVKRGDLAYREQDLVTASTEWNTALKLDPDNGDIKNRLKQVTSTKRAEALRKAAQTAYQAKNYAVALARVEEALALQNNSAGRRLRAQILDAQKRGTSTDLAKAQGYLKSGRLKEAKREADTLRETSPNDAKVLAFVQLVNKRIEDRIAQLKAEGAALRGQGNKDEAAKKYAAVLDLKPTDREAGEAYKNLAGGQAKAVVNQEQVSQLNKKGIFAYLQNNLPEAKRAWEEALKLDPDNAEIRRSLDRVNQKLKAQGAA